MDNNGDKSLEARENKARRAAARQGYRVEKSWAKDIRALTYGTFKIVDADTSAVVAQGDNTTGSGYGLSLEEVEAWLQPSDGDDK